MDEDGHALSEPELLDLSKDDLVRQLIQQRDSRIELDGELDDISREKEEAEERLNDQISSLQSDLEAAQAGGGGSAGGAADDDRRGSRRDADNHAVSELRELVAREKQKFSTLRKQWRETKDQLRDARDSEALTKDELRGAEQDLNAVRAEIKAMKRRTENDMGQSTRAIESMRTMRTDQAELNQTILDLSTRVGVSDTTNEALSEELRTLRAEKAQFEEAEMELRTELADVQDAEADAKRQMEGLHDDLEELTRAKNDSLATIDELRTALSEIRDAKDEAALVAKTEITKLTEAVDTLTSQIEEERETFQTGRMHEELAELKEEKEKLQETFSRTSGATEGIKAELAESRQRIFTLEEDMEGEVEIKTAAIRRGMAALERERDQMAELVENAERHNQGLMLKLSELQEACDEATRWRSTYEEGNGLEEYRKEHDAIEASLKQRDEEMASTRSKMNGMLEQIDSLDQQVRLTKEKAIAAGVHEDELVYEAVEINEAAKSEAMHCRKEVEVLSNMNEVLEQTRLSLLTKLRTLTLAAVDTDVDSGVGSTLAGQIITESSDEDDDGSDSDGGGRRSMRHTMSKSTRRVTGLAHLDLDREQRLHVFEFAVNLQRGVTKLPLDDRSAHFKKALDKAVVERDQMRTALSVFKTELGGTLGGGTPRLSGGGGSSGGGVPYGGVALTGMVPGDDAQRAATMRKMQRMQLQLEDSQREVAELRQSQAALGSGGGVQGGYGGSSSGAGGSTASSSKVAFVNENSEGALRSARTEIAILRSKLTDSIAAGQRAQQKSNSAEARARAATESARAAGVSIAPHHGGSSGDGGGSSAAGGLYEGEGLESIIRAGIAAVATTTDAPPRGESWRDGAIELSKYRQKLTERDEELQLATSQLGECESTLTTLVALNHELQSETTRRESEHAKIVDDLRAQVREREVQLSAAAAIEAAGQPLPGSTLSGTKAAAAAAQRMEGATLSRLLTLEGKHHQLARKYNVLKASEAAARDRTARLQRELDSAITTTRQRVLYLEKWKVWASSQLNRQQTTLQEWAPRFSLLRNQRALTVCKNLLRDTIAKEAVLRSQVMRNHDLPQRLENLKVEVEEAKNRERVASDAAIRLRADAEKMRNQLTEHHKNGGNSRSSPRQQGSSRGGGGRDPRMLELEIARLTDRADEAVAAREEAEVRADRAEGALGAAIEAQEDAVAEARNHSDELKRLAFSLAEETNEAAASHEQRRVELARSEEERAKIEGELRHCEKTLDLMTKQARALARAADDATEEEDAMRGLREELLDLASRDDDSAIIGKMQRELMQAKSAAQHAARKFDAAMHSLRERELGMRRLMFKHDRQHTLLLELKEQATERELAHRQALVEAVTHQSGVDGRRTAAMERTLAELTRACEAQQHELNEAQQRQGEAEDRYSAQQAERVALRQSSAQLKSLLAHEDGATKHVATRLLSLDDALREKSKDAMRLGRALKKATAELDYATKRRTDAEEAAALLEERLVEAQSRDTLGDQGVKHQLRQLAQQSGGSGSGGGFDGGAATLSGLLTKGGGGAGGGALSVGGYETARGKKHWDTLRTQNAEMAKELGEKRTECDELTSRVTEARDAKEELEAELAMTKRSLDIANGGDGSSVDISAMEVLKRKHARPEDMGETRQLQEAAQQTVASLNMLLEKKQAAYKRAMRLIEEERADSASTRERDLRRINDLSDRLASANANGMNVERQLEQRAIRDSHAPPDWGHASAAAASGGGGGGAGGASETRTLQLAAKVQEAEEALIQLSATLQRKEMEISTFRQKAFDATEQSETELGRANDARRRVAALEDQLSDVTATMDAKETTYSTELKKKQSALKRIKTMLGDAKEAFVKLATKCDKLEWELKQAKDMRSGPRRGGGGRGGGGRGGASGGGSGSGSDDDDFEDSDGSGDDDAPPPRDGSVPTERVFAVMAVLDRVAPGGSDRRQLIADTLPRVHEEFSVGATTEAAAGEKADFLRRLEELPFDMSAADASQIANHLDGEAGSSSIDYAEGVVDAARWLSGSNVPDPLPLVAADVNWRPKRRLAALGSSRKKKKKTSKKSSSSSRTLAAPRANESDLTAQLRSELKKLKSRLKTFGERQTKDVAARIALLEQESATSREQLRSKERALTVQHTELVDLQKKERALRDALRRERTKSAEVNARHAGAAPASRRGGGSGDTVPRALLDELRAQLDTLEAQKAMLMARVGDESGFVTGGAVGGGRGSTKRAGGGSAFERPRGGVMAVGASGGSSESRTAWEAQKKLQRRVVNLQRRLTERERELKGVAQKEKVASEEASRLRTELSAAGGGGTRGRRGRGGAAAAPSSAESSADPGTVALTNKLRSRVRALEAEREQWAAEARENFLREDDEGEASSTRGGRTESRAARRLRPGWLAQHHRFAELRRQLDTMRERCARSEAVAEGATRRLRSVDGEKRVSRGGGRNQRDHPDLVRAERAQEALYLRASELEDQLKQTRRECTAAEEASLDADRRALETRFEMEEMRAKLVESESRLALLEEEEQRAADDRRRGVSRAGGTRNEARTRLYGDKQSRPGSGGDARGGRKPLQLSPLANQRGDRGRGGDERGDERGGTTRQRPRSHGSRGATRRERELEQTVEKLRMVLETKQSALKQKDTVATRMSDALRQNRRLKSKLEDAEATREKGVLALEAKAKITKECDVLRDQIRVAEQTAQKARARAKKMARANSDFKARISEMEIEADTLRQRALRTVAPVHEPHAPLRGLAVHDLEAEVEHLKEKNRALVLARERSDRDRPRRGGSSGSGSSDADTGRLQDALLEEQRHTSQLEGENASLKEELSALTPEFFEEVENLKFRYQEAIDENDRLRERVRRGA